MKRQMFPQSSKQNLPVVLELRRERESATVTPNQSLLLTGLIYCIISCIKRHTVTSKIIQHGQ